MTAPMTLRSLEWRLRLRGPVVAAWPEAERLAALALLRQSALAREQLAAALAGADRDDPPCAAILHRMQARLRHEVATRTRPARLGLGARWGALAACAMLGAWLGVALPAGQNAAGDPLQAAIGLAFGGPFGSLQP